jgi:hypothetical protein
VKVLLDENVPHDLRPFLAHHETFTVVRMGWGGVKSCVAHLIRRCRDLAEVATPAAAGFPLAVKKLLEQGLCLRDRYLAQKITLHGLWTATGRLEAKLDHLLDSSESLGLKNWSEPRSSSKSIADLKWRNSSKLLWPSGGLSFH